MAFSETFLTTNSSDRNPFAGTDGRQSWVAAWRARMAELSLIASHRPVGGCGGKIDS